MDAEFAGFVLLEQAQSDAVHHGEVLGSMARAFSAEVPAKGHVKHPVQFVFDAPVSANGC